MSGPPTSPVYYPFAAVPSTSNSNVFPYDIVINEVFPGLIFDPTEAGSVYSVIREVNGCLWFVVNADWDATSLQWTQEDPTNPNVPAYAMEICAAGTWNWYSGAPTSIPGNPITWRQIVLINADGSIVSTPQVVTASGDASQQLNITWNLGSAAQAIARAISVTDDSSSSTSALDYMEVNGLGKWLIDKTGTLQEGIIPYARITGAPSPPSFNNPTFTGTSTFTGPVDMGDGLTVTGAATDVTVLNVSAGATISGGLTVPNGEAVTGGLTADSLTVSGTTDLHNVVITSGDTITVNGTTPVVTLQSTDGSIAISLVSPVEYNITTGNSGGHIAIGGATVTYGGSPLSLTVPSNGSSWNVVCQAFIAYSSTGGANSLTVTGTGGSAGGAWASGSDSVSTLPTTTFGQYTLQLNGLANPGNTVTCTVTSSGSLTVLTSNIQITAFRVS